MQEPEIPIDPENLINIQVKKEGQEEAGEGGKEGEEVLAGSEALPASQTLPASPKALAPAPEALKATSEVKTP